MQYTALAFACLALASCVTQSTDDVAEVPAEQLTAVKAALAQLKQRGVDLSRDRSIHFQLTAPSATVAYRIADAAAAEGFETRVGHGDDERFTVWCTRVMMPNANDIARTATVLDRLARHFGGYADGWSTEA